MKTFKLNNGVEIPVLGFGVFQIPQEQTKQAVLDAIEVGYRHFDTAQSYFNEEEVGDAIAETIIPRENLFITTKVWLSNYGYENTKTSITISLEKMKLDYLDLVLLHQPFGDVFGSYKALVDLQKEGKIRAIGVSNFNELRLADIISFQDTVPQINQIEINPFHQREEDLQNALSRGNVQLEAWAPFAEGKNGIFENEILSVIGKKYGKSPAQVILRWLYERGIVSLAKSVKKDRMKQNIDIFNFSLTSEDKEQIGTLQTSGSQFFDHDDPKTVDFFEKLVKEREI
ncbi:voltage-dependent potassium channel beta subunit [Lactococcus cremoris]|jgi:diketogulonate reductase-like aldo/keto reductase|uniref:2,5-diketo-D-gluconic acid reductase n=1 Tax=Lactococcus cremoris subsp. cremoris IBB477 TaxID=1449093 RepID=A0A1E7G3G1_LACLC|nr:aldo/keto reductase [Lactococcus cremoris]KKW72902.1 voltage-dependent potassium channel beta subunit [Lactococcus cremoris]MCT0457228.1 aldo/keto reductase [Lactococcus cremoris]MCT0478572.1 aldo/keto reductase [Lactococcus cremoris]MCT0509753.1 aldo/keto reductase [Lactococcus cremoris]OEU39506.1 2,5-diketo-D-gluconic acid reductase [Lactococcus cremoris subsp. cremoris IBB477]